MDPSHVVRDALPGFCERVSAARVKTTLTAALHREDGRRTPLHLRPSVGVPDAEVLELRARRGRA